VDKVYPNHHSIDDHISVLRAKLEEQANPVRPSSPQHSLPCTHR
jgi:DNA-binding response OmpR family regulator